ncbi:MAG TPA: SDR family NAD(P)-dependent oxidoreductase [Longimicrobiales bacterium]|nr:SDR family NAD(P)-dependent oxidoreductase [Longimicrobiales bacterium]
MARYDDETKRRTRPSRLPHGDRGDAATADPEEVDQVVEALLDEVGSEVQVQPLFDAEGMRGKVAIVTGASSGIGRAVALDLARCGIDVAFCFLDSGSKSRVDAHKVARRLREAEVRVYFRACDVRDSHDVRRFVAEAVEELGGIHILVNNAGVSRDRPLWRMQDHEWESVVRTNLDGAFFFTRAVAPLMRSQEYGKIVNVSSVHGIRSVFGISNYASSKAALIGFTQSCAIELGPRNINVNAVAPGYIRTTRLTEDVPADVLDRAREESALGRLGDPQDVSSVILFLCSESARHITGAVIPIDGGYLL